MAVFKQEDGDKKHKTIREHAPSGLPEYSGVFYIKSIINVRVTEVSSLVLQRYHAL